MRVLLSSITFFVLSNIQAQKSEFLDLSQKAEIDSILQQFEEDRNLQFLALAPSVGYDPLDNSFQIGFNLSNLTNYFQTRRRNKIELSKLRVQLEEKALRENDILAREEEALKKAFLEFQLEFQSYLIDASNFEIWSHLHEIAVGKMEAGDITTEEYLRAKLQFSNQYKALFQQVERLILKAQDLAVSLDIPEYAAILQKQREKILQVGKNFGVLGAEPLSHSQD